MRMLISGEGPTDLGACNNAQGRCSDKDLNRGPMAVWLARLWEALLHYDLFDVPESVVFVSETALNQKSKQAGGRLQSLRGKKQMAETKHYFNNALQLGLMAKELAQDEDSPVMAVLFRDADGTRSAPGQLWQTKWDSIESGFSASAFKFGVPMLPKPKSEVWLLGATQQGQHSHAVLEDISGNDDSPNSAKTQLDAALGGHQSAAQLASWCETSPVYWAPVNTMPSFNAFYDRFHEVANALLRPKSALSGLT